MKRNTPAGFLAGTVRARSMAAIHKSRECSESFGHQAAFHGLAEQFQGPAHVAEILGPNIREPRRRKGRGAVRIFGVLSEGPFEKSQDPGFPGRQPREILVRLGFYVPSEREIHKKRPPQNLSRGRPSTPAEFCLGRTRRGSLPCPGFLVSPLVGTASLTAESRCQSGID